MNKKWYYLLGVFLLSSQLAFGAMFSSFGESPEDGGNYVWVENDTKHSFRIAIEAHRGAWIYGFSPTSPLIIEVKAKDGDFDNKKTAEKQTEEFVRAGYGGSYVQFYDPKTGKLFDYRIPENGFPEEKYIDDFDEEIMVNAFWNNEGDKKGWKFIIRETGKYKTDKKDEGSDVDGDIFGDWGGL